MTLFPLPPANSGRQLVVAACLLAALVTIAFFSGVPTLAAPFSATCALLALLPKSPFSQPKAILLSHIICVGIGAALVLLPLALPVWGLVLLATFISIALMVLFRAVHAPAVAHAAILSLGNQSVGEYAFWALVVAFSFAFFAYISALPDERVGGKITAPKG